MARQPHIFLFSVHKDAMDAAVRAFTAEWPEARVSNLLDDSHWLPAATRQRIEEQPGHYWLLHLDCYSATPEEAGILRL